MDPFSITVGVAGLLTTATAVIKFLDTAVSTIQDAPRALAWALAEVTDVRSSIARLHHLIQHIDSVPVATRRLIAVQDTAVAVSELIGSFDHLVSLLKHHGLMNPAALTAWDKVNWARRQDDVAKAILRIQTHKASITLMLNILQCESDVVAIESRATLESKINTVIECSTAVQRRLEQMERLFIASLSDPSATSRLFQENASIIDKPSRLRDQNSLKLQSLAANLPYRPSPPSTPVPKIADTRLIDACGTITADTGLFPPEVSETLPAISGPPSFRLEFEETLEASHVYRRVRSSPDALSALSSDCRSGLRTIMTNYSLADDASILSAYPILDRGGLGAPEFYSANLQEKKQEAGLLSVFTSRRLKSSDPQTAHPPSLSRRLQRAPNCSESVMGPWHKSTTRIWRATQFRFEIQFDAPVIFLCPPTNTYGPVHSSQIIFLDGSAESRDMTTTCGGDPMSTKANFGPASWLTLLRAIQDMESQSQHWQEETLNSSLSPHLPLGFQSDFRDKRTLNVALQKSRQSLDMMPPNLQKPWAITTMCHLVELLAMLGVHWLTFDWLNDRYHASGNGFLVKGQLVPDLGIVFDFKVIGQWSFRENRVIPVDQVKALCFGLIPTLYRGKDEPRWLNQFQHRRLDTLQLSSPKEMANTLARIGCNAVAVNYILEGNHRDYHLFPFAFEIMGMVGETLHVKNSCFRRLPNPTFCAWVGADFSFPSLIASFQSAMLNTASLSSGSLIMERINKHISRLRVEMDGTGWVGLELLILLHQVVEDVDEVLTARVSNSQAQRGRRREMVRQVLCIHIQEVLRCMSEKSSNGTEPTGNLEQPRFETIYTTSSDDKYAALMDFYVKVIRCSVVAEAGARSPSLQQLSPARSTEYATATSAGERGAHPSSSGVTEAAERSDPDELWGPAVTHEEIWCILVFRMMCWLMLHDFDRNDVQICKSELLASRLPVYII